jgi:hypothetical protein
MAERYHRFRFQTSTLVPRLASYRNTDGKAHRRREREIVALGAGSFHKQAKWAGEELDNFDGFNGSRVA